MLNTVKSLSSFKLVTIFTALVSSISVIFILLSYSHGNLLIAQDQIGFYNEYDLTLPFLSSSNVLNFVLFFLSFGNIYLVFYSSLFVSCFFAVILSAYLGKTVLSAFSDLRKSEIGGLISSVLFLFNPFTLTVDFQSFIDNFSMINVFYIAFLVVLFTIWINYKDQKKSRRTLFILLGITLAFSLSPFPNNIRIVLSSLVFAILLFAPLFIYRFVKGARNLNKENSLKAIFNIVLAIIVFFVFSLYSFLPLLTNFNVFTGLAVSSAQNFISLVYYTGPFNTFPQVIRLLTSWEFFSYYAPYSSLYQNLTPLFVSSFMWPLTVFGTILFSGRMTRHLKVSFLQLIAIIIIILIWEMGGNFPFGFIWYYINAHIPYGYQLIPTGLLTSLFLTKLYPIFSAFFVVSLWTSNPNNVRGSADQRFKRLKAYSVTPIAGRSSVFSIYKQKIIAVCILTLLVFTLFPFFNGQLEGNFFDSNSTTYSSGFHLPNHYQSIRNYLMSQNASVLLFPGVQNYILTTWNYFGTSQIYLEVFAPVKIYTIQSFGGTAITENNSTKYKALTHPIDVLNNSKSTINETWISYIKNYNISYILLDRSIVNNIYYTLDNNSYVNMTIETLQELGTIKEISQYSNSMIILYEINYSRLISYAQ